MCPPPIEHEPAINPEQHPTVFLPQGHLAIPIPPIFPRNLRREQCHPTIGQLNDNDAGCGIMNNLQFLTHSGYIHRSLSKNAGGRWDLQRRCGIFNRHTVDRCRGTSCNSQKQEHARHHHAWFHSSTTSTTPPANTARLQTADTPCSFENSFRSGCSLVVASNEPI